MIVCTLNRVGPLERLLTSLTKQILKDFEVVVVDQNTPGLLDELLAAYSEQLALRRTVSRPGLSRARNIGLQHAIGQCILFPDDDCWYTADFLMRLKGAFDAAPYHDIITGRTVDSRGVDSVSTPLPHSRIIDRSVVLAAGNSASLFVRRRVFDRIGDFDERFGLGAATGFESSEELDFLVRALHAGFGIAYSSELAVFHDQVYPGNYEAQVRRTASYATGYGAMLRKNRFGTPFLVMLIARTLGGIAVRAVRRRPLLVRQKVALSRNVVRGYVKWIP